MTARLRPWFTLTLLCGALSGVARAQDDSAFIKTDAMVPVRDGVKLHTVIFAPRDARERLPILLERTPYGAMADEQALRARYAHLIADGYIFAFQDIRGRFHSEGQFVMQRQVRDRRDPKAIDESTDTYDTIEWLLENVKGHNGRAGILGISYGGISYGGWLATMALLDPHPALKAASEQASPADYVPGRRLSSQRRVPAELRVRVRRPARDIQGDQHQFRLRPRRHLSLVSGSGRASQCR
ncbi:MAG TPA: CocE/NonD family hydrolase [Bryobacteraceae bacterium]|nr:CocE/NonD family hydrolase [Bryobacteraceae bacterium]